MSVVSKPTLITSKEDAVSAPSIALYYPFAGVRPVAQELNANGTEVTIRFEAEEGAWPACSNCYQVSFDVHSYGSRRVRDLAMAQLKVWLEIPQRKVRCESCGVRVEALEFVEPSRRFTRRFERAVADLLPSASDQACSGSLRTVVAHGAGD